MTQRTHLTSLVAGIVLVALGTLLVLDTTGSIHLGFAYAAPAVVAVLGFVLIAAGLEARSRD
jgi:hypothetical protein